MSTKEETKVELKNISKINEPNFEFLVKTDLPIVFCQNGLFFMSLAHEFGNIKYKKYSWRNDPEGSNSLPEDSLNAIFRHVFHEVCDLPLSSYRPSVVVSISSVILSSVSSLARGSS